MSQNNVGKSDLSCNVRASWAHEHLLSIRKQGQSEALNMAASSSQLHNYQLGRADEDWKAQHCYQNTIYPNKIYMKVNL